MSVLPSRVARKSAATCALFVALCRLQPARNRHNVRNVLKTMRLFIPEACNERVTESFWIYVIFNESYGFTPTPQNQLLLFSSNIRTLLYPAFENNVL